MYLESSTTSQSPASTKGSTSMPTMRKALFGCLMRKAFFGRLMRKAFFGRLIADGPRGIDEGIDRNKIHLTHYLVQLVRLDGEWPAFHYVPSPITIARKLLQIWRATHVFLEDVTAACFQQAAVRSFHHLSTRSTHTWKASTMVATRKSSCCEALSKALTLFSEVWEIILDLAKGKKLDTSSKLCLHLPPKCASVAAYQYCQDMISNRLIATDFEVLCIHHANTLDYTMGAMKVYMRCTSFCSPSILVACSSMKQVLAALMFHYLKIRVSQSDQVPHEICFYNSKFTDVQRVSHQGIDFWAELELSKKAPEGSWWTDSVSLKLFGPDEKMSCPLCGETV
ncbi:hypothetical protein IAR50_001790 [Cryptococcus sp. DSM 104548]